MGSKCCCCLTDSSSRKLKNVKYQQREPERVFKRVERAIIGVDQDGHRCINEYRIVAELCSHAHGRVCICEDRGAKSDRAMAIRYAMKISPKVGSMSNNEINVLKNLEHSNLVHLIEVIDDPQVSERYMILEYLEGGAIMTIGENGQADGPRYSEADAQKYMTQLVSALDYLHGRNIVHGNIKPENILLTKDRQTCKLTDFQMSTAGLEHDTKKIRHSKENRHEMPWFRAPEEFIAGEVVAGRACDIWALGATLYAMVFGVVPFQGTNEQEVADNATSQALSFPDIPISRTLRMLLRRTLEKDLLVRITLNEILDDPWVTGETIWEGKSRERAGTRATPKVMLSEYELLKQKASTKKKLERIPGRHILVAEDVYLVRELVVRMIKGILAQDVEDTDVDAVVDGDEAVEAVQKKNYALIFMDLHMSRMSGFDATLQIRDYENTSSLEPCIIIGLTGDLHEEISEVCVKVGMNEVATKPLRPNQARALLERYNFKVSWEKALDPKSLTSDGKSNVFLKSYCRYLQKHGEALKITEDTTTRAAQTLLMLHTRKVLPFFEEPTSDQVCLRSIVGYIGYHGLEDEGPSEASDNEEQPQIVATENANVLEIRQAISLRDVKSTITKKAESVRTGIDSYGKKYINEYTILSQLGVGAYGTVYQVVNTYNGQIYALKSANKRQLTKSVGSFRIEVEILQTLNHPNIIKVFEIIDDPNSQEVYFVIEYVEGGSVATVDSVGHLNKKLSEVEAKKLMAQCIAGLEYLHGHNVVHRDIKPDNILMDKTSGMYKLSDFGVSHFLASDADDALKNLSGTPLFAAPETCKGCGESYSGKAADIWALGITLYGLIYGQVPFEVQSQYQLFKDIQTKEITFPEKPKISSELRVLLGRMLEKDVLLRITGPEVRDHSWLTGKENIIRKVSKEVREANKKRHINTSQPVRPVSDNSGPQNILIVEDVFLVRELLRKMFTYVLDIPKEEEDRFAIDCVADGDEAIEAYKEKKYNLVLMDVHMPKVSGFDATLRMREIEIDKGLPRAAIVGQTADVHERINEVCMEVGMDEVIQKPLTPSLLRGVCVRYGFSVKKNAPIPKDLFDKGHSFVSSFKQYIERCDPGTLQPNRLTQSASTFKLEHVFPDTMSKELTPQVQVQNNNSNTKNFVSDNLLDIVPSPSDVPKGNFQQFSDVSKSPPKGSPTDGKEKVGGAVQIPLSMPGRPGLPRQSNKPLDLRSMSPPQCPSPGPGGPISPSNWRDAISSQLQPVPMRPGNPSKAPDPDQTRHHRHHKNEDGDPATDDLTVSATSNTEMSPHSSKHIRYPLGPPQPKYLKSMEMERPARGMSELDVVSDMHTETQNDPESPISRPSRVQSRHASFAQSSDGDIRDTSPSKLTSPVVPNGLPLAGTAEPARVPQIGVNNINRVVTIEQGVLKEQPSEDMAVDEGAASPRSQGPILTARLPDKPVDPRAFIGAFKKTSKLKVLLPEEVLPVIQTLLIGEVQKKHENVSQFLTEEEITWIREETIKLYLKAEKEKDPLLHLEDGVDETQLRKMVHAVLPELVAGIPTTEPPRHLCTAYAAQECGKRDAQEDAFVCLNQVAQLFDWPYTGTPLSSGPAKKLVCCAVYDGHGGRTASEYCRNQFHLFVLRALQSNPALQTALPVAMAKCNDVYNDKADKANSNAGTTAAVLFIEEDTDGGSTLVAANVGDCRIVLCTDGQAKDLTRDHKPCDEEERRRIEAVGGEVMFNSGAWRVNGVLTVSRALGSVRSCQKYLSCIPDITTHKIAPTDEFAVIASDGLWNVMSSEKVVEFVLEAKREIDGAGEADEEDEEDEDEEGNEGMSYQLIAEGLVGHAIEELHSDDNVTVIIIFFDHNYQNSS